MASSSNPWIQQIQRVWVPMLKHSSTMKLSDFYRYFCDLIQPAIDIVVIYDNNNTQCGFGFVVNDKSLQTGGHFRRVPYWADRLKIKIAVFSNTMMDKHCTARSLNNGLKSVSINYAQLQSPLISSLLQQSQIVSYFKDLHSSYDFQVVALLPDQPCGFGFVQIPPVISANVGERNYLDELRALVHQLMEIVDGGITATCANGFTPPAAVRPFFNLPSVLPPGSYSSSYAQSDSNFVMQHQQPESSLHSQPRAALIPSEDTNTPSGAYMWSGQLTSNSRLSGGGRNTNQLSGNRNAAGMQQQQPFILSQTTTTVFPYEANIPSGAYVWSDQTISSNRLSGGERNTNQWLGNRNTAGVQPQQSFIFYEANIPSGANVWSGQATSTGIFPGSDQDTNQWSESRNAAVTQQPHTPSGAYLWSGQGTSTIRISGGERNTNQLLGNRNAAGMQQQQSFILSQTTTTVFPYEANIPSGAYVWSDQTISSNRLSGGERNTNQWLGNRNAAGVQPQQSFIHYEANIPSGANVWSGQATSTGIFPGSDQDTNQWSESRNAAVTQQPHTPSGAYLWSGQGTSTIRISGGEQNANQLLESTNEAVMQQQQQQPESFTHSRATGNNRQGQNRNAYGNPPQNSTA